MSRYDPQTDGVTDACGWRVSRCLSVFRTSGFVGPGMRRDDGEGEAPVRQLDGKVYYPATTNPSRNVTIRSIRPASSGLCVAINAASP